jgi:AraC-like DNA-binding protein
MPLYEPYLPTRYVAPLFTILNEHGSRCVGRIVARAGLSGEKLQSDGSFVTFGEFDRLLCAAADELRRDDLGFELGRVITMDDHDALSMALRQCTTADALLRMVARFRTLLTNGMFFVYERRAFHGELTIRPAAAVGTRTLYALEELFSVSIHNDMTALLAHAPGMEIFLSMPRPAHVERYRALRPTRFHFGANALPEVRCRIPAALLDRPLVQPSASEPRPTRLLLGAGHGGVDSREYSQWVAMILREAEGVQPSLSDLARLLNISARTLNRKLMTEGTSLRRLNTTIRFDRASRLLSQSTESISQIAYRLGYSSPTSFHTAFRKSAKRGPREFRACVRPDRSR